MYKVATIALTILVASATLSTSALAQQSKADISYRVQQEKPDGFELLGNYPNPVRNKSFFKFRLDEPQQVAIHLYDLLGNQKRSTGRALYNSGTHTVKLEVSGLQKGIYFYKIQVKNKTITKRLNIVNQ